MYKTNLKGFSSSPFFDENPFLDPSGGAGILGDTDYSLDPMQASPFFTEEDKMQEQINKTLGIGGQAIEPFSEQQALAAIQPGQGPQVPPMPAAQPPAEGNWMDKVVAFGTSPGWAQARQAIQNSANAQRGQPVTRSAPQAYQEVVNQRAILAQREQMAKLREAQEARLRGADTRAQEKHDVSMDPGWEFNALRDANLIPKDMSFEQYETTFGRRATDDPAAIREWRYYNSMTPDEQKRYLTMKRASQLVPGGGGTQNVMGPDGSVRPLSGGPTVESYSSNEERLAEARTTGTKGAEYDIGQVTEATDRIWANQEGYQMAERMRDVSVEFKDKLARGDVDTGLFDGFLLNTLGIGTAELAGMKSEEVLATLNSLGITNLAPVTVQELQYVAKLWANISAQPEANEGTLDRAIRRSEALMQKLQLDTRNQVSRVEQYGRPGDRESILASNPWVESLYRGNNGGGGGEQRPPGASSPEDIPAVDDDVTMEYVPGQGLIKR